MSRLSLRHQYSRLYLLIRYRVLSVRGLFRGLYSYHAYSSSTSFSLNAGFFILSRLSYVLRYRSRKAKVMTLQE